LAQVIGWAVVAVGAFFVLAALDTLDEGFRNGMPSLIVGVLLVALGALPVLAARRRPGRRF
jgi:uncharacterized membrane protein HdeD (DUF308 family)